MNPEKENYEFSTFISYRRSDGSKIAKWLKSKLENYKLPKKIAQQKDHKLKVYLDKTYERATDDFWKKEIDPSLEQSRFLIVVCTPDAYKNQPGGRPNGVEREIEKFRSFRQKDNIIVVHSGNSSTENLPGDLNQIFPNMEIIDFQSFSPMRFLSLSKYLYLNDELHKIVATLYDINAHDMPILKKENARRTYSRLGIAFSVGIIFLLILAWSAIVAQRNAVIAKRNETSALQAIEKIRVNNAIQRISEGAVFEGLSWLSQTLENPQQDSIQKHKNRVRFSSFMRQSPKLSQVLFHDVPVNYVDFSPDGKLIATAGGIAYQPTFGLAQEKRGHAQIWSIETGNPVSPALLHDATVYSAVFSPDGKRVVTASEDGTARIWDVATGREVVPVLKHKGTVRRAVFSPDGKYVLCGGAGFANLWEVATGKCITPDFWLETAVWNIYFSPDSRFFAVSTVDFSGKVGSQFVLWDIVNSDRIDTQFEIDFGVDCLDFSPNSNKFVTASNEVAQIWDMASRKKVGDPLNHNAALVDIRFLHDGRKIVSVGEGGNIRMWSEYGFPIADEKKIKGYQKKLLTRHSGRVKYADLSPDDRRIATISTDGTARVWDTATALPVTPPLYHSFTGYSDPDSKLIITNRTHPGDEIFVRFSPDGRRIATAGWDGLAKVWDLATGWFEDVIFYPEASMRAVSVSTDGRHVALITGQYTVQLYDFDGTQKKSNVLSPGLDKGFFSAEYSPGGRFIVLEAGGKETIPIINLSGTLPKGDNYSIVDAWNSKTPETSNIHHNYICKPYFLKGDSSVVTVDQSNRVSIWTNKDALELDRSFPMEGDIKAVVLSNDGERIAALADNNRIVLRDVATNDHKELPISDAGTISFMTFSHDNEYLVFLKKEGSANFLVSVKTDNIENVVTTRINKKKINVLHVNPTHNTAVSAHKDGTARVWDFVEGGPLTAELMHEKEKKPTGLIRIDRPKGVLSADFSPDGSWVVTGGTDATVRIWDAYTGLPASIPQSFDTEIKKVQFSHDGKHIHVITESGVVWDINFSPIAQTADDLVQLTQILGGKKIDGTGNITNIDRDSFEKVWFRQIKKNPDLFIPSSQSIRGWHLNAAMSCMNELNHDGLQFHLDKLIGPYPDKMKFFRQKGNAE